MPSLQPFRFAAAAVALFAASCGYVRNVRDDFLDIGNAAVGIVPPILPGDAESAGGDKAVGFFPPAYGVYVEATDFVHLGALHKHTLDLEWDRRGLGAVNDDRTKLGFGPWHKVELDVDATWTNDYLSTGNELDGWRAHMAAMRDPIFDRAAKQMTYEKAKFARPQSRSGGADEQRGLHRGWQDWESFSLEVAVPEPFLLHTGIYLRAGFDPSQIFDFALSLIGLDLYGDNAYRLGGAVRYPNDSAK